MEVSVHWIGDWVCPITVNGRCGENRNIPSLLLSGIEPRSFGP